VVAARNERGLLLRALQDETSVGLVAGEQLDCILKTAPGWVDSDLKPSAEGEPVGACLANDDAKKFLPGHSVFSFPQIL
jgi:hypothetical protein